MSNDDFDCVVDPVYRKPNEWARIYNIHLIDRADNICRAIVARHKQCNQWSKTKWSR